jgi:hypothetical protein
MLFVTASGPSANKSATSVATAGKPGHHHPFRQSRQDDVLSSYSGSSTTDMVVVYNRRPSLPIETKVWPLERAIENPRICMTSLPTSCRCQTVYIGQKWMSIVAVSCVRNTWDSNLVRPSTAFSLFG